MVRKRLNSIGILQDNTILVTSVTKLTVIVIAEETQMKSPRLLLFRSFVVITIEFSFPFQLLFILKIPL